MFPYTTLQTHRHAFQFNIMYTERYLKKSQLTGRNPNLSSIRILFNLEDRIRT